MLIRFSNFFQAYSVCNCLETGETCWHDRMTLNKFEYTYRSNRNRNAIYYGWYGATWSVDQWMTELIIYLFSGNCFGWFKLICSRRKLLCFGSVMSTININLDWFDLSSNAQLWVGFSWNGRVLIFSFLLHFNIVNFNVHAIAWIISLTWFLLQSWVLILFHQFVQSMG